MKSCHHHQLYKYVYVYLSHLGCSWEVNMEEGEKVTFKRRHKVDEQTFSLTIFSHRRMFAHSFVTFFLATAFFSFPSSSILHFYYRKNIPFHLIKDKHSQLYKFFLLSCFPRFFFSFYFICQMRYGIRNVQ